MKIFQVPNQYRIRHGSFGSTDDIGNNGAFSFVKDGIEFHCIASDGLGWEHVSITINRNRTPTWEQMCFVKELFWPDPDACVLQYHPAVKDYVNLHPHCLHLWRPTQDEIPKPPTWMIG